MSAVMFMVHWCRVVPEAGGFEVHFQPPVPEAGGGDGIALLPVASYAEGVRTIQLIQRLRGGAFVHNRGAEQVA